MKIIMIIQDKKSDEEKLKELKEIIDHEYEEIMNEKPGLRQRALLVHPDMEQYLKIQLSYHKSEIDERYPGKKSNMSAKIIFVMDLIEYLKNFKTHLGCEAVDVFLKCNPLLGTELSKDLVDAIQTVAKEKEKCVTSPSAFSRVRKISFEGFLALTLSSRTYSLQTEAFHLYDYNFSCITKSAIAYRRKQIAPIAYKKLFVVFSRKMLRRLGLHKQLPKCFKGKTVVAVDGSLINVFCDPLDETTLNSNGRSKPYSQIRASVLFDCLNERILDADLAGFAESDERAAFIRLLSQIAKNPEKYIILADRGYDGWGQLTWLVKNGFNFCIRTKDSDVPGSMLSTLGLPSGEYDENIHRFLTRSRRKEYRENSALYKCVSGWVPGLEKIDDLVEIDFRVACVEVAPDTYETLLTNLPCDVFPLDVLKELYNLRWREECAFHHFKSDLCGEYFHHKKRMYVEQELWAHFTLYNFISAIHLAINDDWVAVEKTIPQSLKDKFNVKHDHEIRFVSTGSIYRDILDEELKKLLPQRFHFCIKLPYFLAFRFRNAIRFDKKIVPRNVRAGFFHSFLARAA